MNSMDIAGENFNVSDLGAEAAFLQVYAPRKDDISTHLVVLRTIFIAVDSVFTILSNLFCIWVIYRTPTLSDSAKVFMIALAAADFSVGVIAAFSVVPAATGNWFWGEGLCRATAALVTIFCLASVSFLVCLSVDRMIAVKKSLHYPNIMTRKKAVVITVGVCVASVAAIGGSWLLSPPVLYSNVSATCAWKWNNDHIIYACVISLCFFILPSSVLIVMYWIMFKISRKHTRMIANQAPVPTTSRDVVTQQPQRAAPQLPQGEHKAIKMFCVITIAFTVAWLPYSVAILYSSIQNVPVPQWLGFLVTWGALSNSWFNVIIYVCMNGALRETACRLLRNQKCRRFARCCNKSRAAVVNAPQSHNDQAYDITS
ncbi:trace amine-associated receptor 9-like [Asterias amurensis]|uniref:trace amine-associated receptor 9-like n=1 Tax=Asterias amurensis TaxID=7602 RepID=UPI003AB90C3E